MLLVCWNAELLRVVRHGGRNGDINAVKYGALMLFSLLTDFFEGWVLYAGSFTFFLYLASLVADNGLPMACMYDKPICGRCLEYKDRSYLRIDALRAFALFGILMVHTCSVCILKKWRLSLELILVVEMIIRISLLAKEQYKNLFIAFSDVVSGSCLKKSCL